MSLAIRSICIASPTPLMLETFLSEAPLAVPNPGGVWPLLVGIGFLSSVEIGRAVHRMTAKDLKESEWARRVALKKELGAGHTTVNSKADRGVLRKQQQQAQQKDSVMERLATAEVGSGELDPPAVKRFQGVIESVARGGSVLMIVVSMSAPGVRAPAVFLALLPDEATDPMQCFL